MHSANGVNHFWSALKRMSIIPGWHWTWPKLLAYQNFDGRPFDVPCKNHSPLKGLGGT